LILVYYTLTGVLIGNKSLVKQGVNLKTFQ